MFTAFVGAAIGRPQQPMRNFPVRAANGRPYESDETFVVIFSSPKGIPQLSILNFQLSIKLLFR